MIKNFFFFNLGRCIMSYGFGRLSLLCIFIILLRRGNFTKLKKSGGPLGQDACSSEQRQLGVVLWPPLSSPNSSVWVSSGVLWGRAAHRTGIHKLSQSTLKEHLCMPGPGGTALPLGPVGFQSFPPSRELCVLPSRQGAPHTAGRSLCCRATQLWHRPGTW